MERHRLKRPCELEFPGSKSVPTLPCIEEESHEYSPPPDSLSPSPHRDQPRSPSVELFPEMSPTQSLESRHTPHRSRTGSLDSKCRDKSRTSSVESTHSRLSEALCLESEAPGGLSESPDSRHRQSLELPSDLEPAKPLSAPHSEGESLRGRCDLTHPHPHTHTHSSCKRVGRWREVMVEYHFPTV